MTANTDTKRVRFIVYSDIEVDALRIPVSVKIVYDQHVPRDKEEEINRVLVDAANRVAKILEH